MTSNKYCDTEKSIGKYFFLKIKQKRRKFNRKRSYLIFHNFLNAYRVRTDPDAEIIMTGGRSRSRNQNSEELLCQRS